MLIETGKRGAPMITGESVGKLNIQCFFETLAKIVGEQENVAITVKSIRQKEPDAVEISKKAAEAS